MLKVIFLDQHVNIGLIYLL